MLNTNINQKLEFHSVSGLMCKSHPKSIICKTTINPYLLDMDCPRKYGGDREKNCCFTSDGFRKWIFS